MCWLQRLLWLWNSLIPLFKDKGHPLPSGEFWVKSRWMLPCYLEEVLAGDDESQLGAEVFCLGLTPSDPLDQLRDVISHCLQEARKLNWAHLAWITRTGWKMTQWCFLAVLSLLGMPVPDFGFVQPFLPARSLPTLNPNKRTSDFPSPTRALPTLLSQRSQYIHRKTSLHNEALKECP